MVLCRLFIFRAMSVNASFKTYFIVAERKEWENIRMTFPLKFPSEIVAKVEKGIEERLRLLHGSRFPFLVNAVVEDSGNIKLYFTSNEV